MSTATPVTQQALFVLSPKGAWSVGSNTVPTPGNGEVLIRIESAALNPVDWKIHDYDFGISEYPAILGTDSAGVVVAVGAGVRQVKVGDKVLHQGRRARTHAIFQQYALASVDLVAKIPSSISFDEAASLPVAVATAAIGLYAPPSQIGGIGLTAPWKEGGKEKYAHHPILIIGGSSAVGQAVIQFAKLSAFNPIITTVSPSNYDLVKSLGATHPVDRNQPLSTLGDSIRKITSAPLKVVFDAISLPDTQNAGYKILGDEGSLIITLPEAVKEEDRVKGKEIAAPRGSAPEQGAFGEELYAHLGGFLENGAIKPNQVEYVPGGLSSVPDALDRLRKNQVSGRKLVVRPTETV